MENHPLNGYKKKSVRSIFIKLLLVNKESLFYNIVD